MKNILKKAAPAFFLVPFVLGSVGYIIEGNRVTDSIYAGFSLYFTSIVLDSYNIWIEIARWTAPLATATAILSIFEKAGRNILWRLQSRLGDSAAVYTDTDIRIVFDNKTRVFYAGRNIKQTAKSHIIMLDSDTASLKFYEENKDKLRGGSVYIGLREIDYGLVKEKKEVHFFDINGAVSRLLWEHAALWRAQKEKASVVIWGGGHLAESILSYGLLTNLYSNKQKITYHMVGNESFQIKHPQMPLMNRDEIIFHSEKDSESWDVVRKADMVIIAESVSAALMQAIAVNGRNARIYYYSQMAGDVGDCLQLTNLIPFGRDADIYTDENIRREKLVEEAKRQNLEYAEKYNGEADWNKLGGFLQWSNISSADFGHVLAGLLKQNPELDDDILAELEHIRWCRFHYLNYWTYGEPMDGRDKDPVWRIHKCLCPYQELSPNNKRKDKTVVAKIRKRMNLTKQWGED